MNERHDPPHQLQPSTIDDLELRYRDEVAELYTNNESRNELDQDQPFDSPESDAIDTATHAAAAADHETPAKPRRKRPPPRRPQTQYFPTFEPYRPPRKTED